MAQALKLSKREARVTHINRRREKEGDEAGPVAVDIGMDVRLDQAEMAQLVRVSEGEPLDFIASLFDSSGNARCLNMKALALDDAGTVSISILIDDETLSFTSELKKAKLAIGESLRGGRLSFQVAYSPDDGNEREAALLLYMPTEVMLIVKPGPQKEFELGEPKGKGEEARPY